MIYLSICLYHLQVISSVSYGFQSIYGKYMGRFILVFYSFWCSGKWDVSLISLFNLFMLVSRSATDFCVLIFSTATLSNLLMSLVIFLVASVSFSTYRILPAANSDCFVSSFTIWISLFILHWLLWLGLPILCWIKVVRVDILVLILIL